MKIIEKAMGPIGARTKLLILFIGFFAQISFAGASQVEYAPGDSIFQSVWISFYEGDHEPELDDPLILAGSAMTKAICEAVKHQDMKYRRYAIGALGFIGDKNAIPTLEKIFFTKAERDYFRADAIISIYRIQSSHAKILAREIGKESNFLLHVKESIANDDKWLVEPTEEHHHGEDD